MITSMMMILYVGNGCGLQVDASNMTMRMMTIMMTMRMRIWSVGSSGVGPCPGRC